MLNYKELAYNYKPEDEIKILLVGEAPPPSGRKYFYSVPQNYKPKSNIERDTSLPGTIFNHFFDKLPNNSSEYEKYLIKLKTNGIFLIDMYEHPIQVRNNKEDSLPIIFSDSNLENLDYRIQSLISEKSEIIFLLARTYKKEYILKLKNKFNTAKFIRWIDFRLKR